MPPIAGRLMNQWNCPQFVSGCVEQMELEEANSEQAYVSFAVITVYTSQQSTRLQPCGPC